MVYFFFFFRSFGSLTLAVYTRPALCVRSPVLSFVNAFASWFFCFTHHTVPSIYPHPPSYYPAPLPYYLLLFDYIPQFQFLIIRCVISPFTVPPTPLYTHTLLRVRWFPLLVCCFYYLLLVLVVCITLFMTVLDVVALVPLPCSVVPLLPSFSWPAFPSHGSCMHWLLLLFCPIYTHFFRSSAVLIVYPPFFGSFFVRVYLDYLQLLRLFVTPFGHLVYWFPVVYHAVTVNFLIPAYVTYAVIVTAVPLLRLGRWFSYGYLFFGSCIAFYHLCCIV